MLLLLLSIAFIVGMVVGVKKRDQALTLIRLLKRSGEWVVSIFKIF